MYREDIDKYIDDRKQEMIDDIKKLCRIDSQRTSYEEGKPFGRGPFEALIAALNMADNYGLDIKNYNNYVGTVDINDKERQLDILAHLDVVPAGEGWTETEAFNPIVKGDKLYGRGTSDDKGPAIAALYAIKAIKDLKIPLKKNVRLILGTDEECGSNCIKYYYSKEREAPMTFSPDGEYPVVNIEKGRLAGNFTADVEDQGILPRVVSIDAGTKVNVVPPKAKVVLDGFTMDDIIDIANNVTLETGIEFTYDLEPAFEITAHGKNAHASTPEHGNNAITGLLLFLSRLPLAKTKRTKILGNLYKIMPHGDITGKNLGIECSDDKSGALTLAFSLLYLKDNKLEGTFDARSPISASPEYLLETCKKTFKEHGIQFENTSMTSPHVVPEDSKLIKVLLKAYEEYTGLEGYCLAIGGGTYVHQLKSGVAFGASLPGTDNNMHGADEFAVVSELIISAKIFAKVIIDVCS